MLSGAELPVCVIFLFLQDTLIPPHLLFYKSITSTLFKLFSKEKNHDEGFAKQSWGLFSPRQSFFFLFPARKCPRGRNVEQGFCGVNTQTLCDTMCFPASACFVMTAFKLWHFLSPFSKFLQTQRRLQNKTTHLWEMVDLFKEEEEKKIPGEMRVEIYLGKDSRSDQRKQRTGPVCNLLCEGFHFQSCSMETAVFLNTPSPLITFIKHSRCIWATHWNLSLYSTDTTIRHQSVKCKKCNSIRKKSFWLVWRCRVS